MIEIHRGGRKCNQSLIKFTSANGNVRQTERQHDVMLPQIESGVTEDASEKAVQEGMRDTIVSFSEIILFSYFFFFEFNLVVYLGCIHCILGA